MKDPRYIRVGKACAAFARYAGWKCVIISILFPGFARVMLELMHAMQPLIEESVFGTDYEIEIAKLSPSKRRGN